MAGPSGACSLPHAITGLSFAILPPPLPHTTLKLVLYLTLAGAVFVWSFVNNSFGACYGAVRVLVYLMASRTPGILATGDL